MKSVNMTIVFICLSVFIVMTGCIKRQSTLHDTNTSTNIDTDSTFVKINPFDGVDTSDDASFKLANLNEELARRAQEALKPVYFEYNSFQLTTEAVSQSSKIAAFLKENPGIRLLIEGHCDERGSSEYNMGLGENRARIIREYLLTYGVAAIRVEVMSFGRESPVRSGCNDEQCHSLNRRCEFKPLAR